VGGTPLIFENWDGYPVERSRFFDNLIVKQIDNVVFVTGDFHCAFALNLSPAPYDTSQYKPATGEGSIAVEFVAPSVSGGNFDEGETFGLPNAESAVGLIKALNPHFKYGDVVNHGYIMLDLTPERAQAEFWYTDNIRQPGQMGENLGAIYLTRTGKNRLEEGLAASPPKPGLPPTPQTPAWPVGRNAETSAQPLVVRLAPNPAGEKSYMQLVNPVSQSLELTLTDMQGRTVWQLPAAEAPAGTYHLPIPVQNLPTGVYSVRLKSAGGIVSNRLIVK
jgi:alkaline phosphatase D